MKCPDCAEEIPGGSRICPICKSNLAGGGGGRSIDPQKAQEIKSKISKLNMLSFVFFIPGLLLQFGSMGVSHPVPPGAIQAPDPAQALPLLGGLLMIIGLGLYASMKGRSPAWGLMGLLSCLGLLFLALMSKCCHNCRQIGGRNETECPNCAGPM